MNFLRNNILFQTVRHLKTVLSARHKKKALAIFFLTISSSILDVLGLAVILPIITVSLNSSIIHSNRYLRFLFHAFGFVSDKSFSAFLLITLLIVFILKNGFSVLITYWQSKFSYSISTDVAGLQFKRYYLKDLQFFNENNSNLLVRNIHTASIWLSVFMLLPLIGFFSELIVLLLIVSGILIYDAKIFLLIAVSLAPLFFLIFRFIKNKMKHLEMSKADLEVESNKSLYQALFGYIDVKLFNKDQHFIDKYLFYQGRKNTADVKLLTLQALPVKVIEISAVLGVLAIIGYSMLMGKAGISLVPLLSLYVVASYRLMPSMNRMLIALTSIKSYQFIFDILAKVNEESDLKNLQKTEKIVFEKNILLKNISYKYPQTANQTLKDITINIKKGERIGFIGQSGAGKTTLINILLRFLKEDKGSITIDNKLQLVDCETNAWRDLIGYVKQNVFIVDGDFYDNIPFGIRREEVNLEKLNQAIVSAKLDDMVNKLPLGLNTNIGENGTKLSGGQRQRIAIARALYKDAQILIFDEATSALDNETEKEITEAIDSLSSQNKTMILIAHRTSTLKHCDRIVELKDGEIIRECSYEELARV